MRRAFGSLGGLTLALSGCGGRTPLPEEEPLANRDASVGGIDASGSDVAPACTPIRAGNACNDLVPSGPQVGETCSLSSPPTATGGTVAEGRYTLTAMEIDGYGGPCP